MIKNQLISNKYSIYEGDSIEVMEEMPNNSIGLSIYSPPFGGLFHYSSNDQDLSNAKDYDEFFKHYEFIVKNIYNITKSGRMSCVHCMDVPRKNGGSLIDFPGDIIKLHEKYQFEYWARYCIWKEPLTVAIRTRSKGLMHKQIVKDSSYCGNAGADYLLVFKKKGENKEPIENPIGLTKYCGMYENIPKEFNMDGIKHYKGFFKNCTNPQKNKVAHWIWQQYASSFWDDIRLNHVLPYKKSKDNEDEKHIHPLQLDVIERCIILWSNEGDIVFTPFMGVGSEVYGALINNRRGIGVELKKSFYNQAIKNINSVKNYKEEFSIFDD